MTVYSYSTYVPEPTESAPTPQPRVRIDADAGRTSSVVFRDGQMTESSTSSSRVTAAELNPYHGSGTVFETAKSKHGI